MKSNSPLGIDGEISWGYRYAIVVIIIRKLILHRPMSTNPREPLHARSVLWNTRERADGAGPVVYNIPQHRCVSDRLRGDEVHRHCGGNRRSNRSSYLRTFNMCRKKYVNGRSVELQTMHCISALTSKNDCITYVTLMSNRKMNDYRALKVANTKRITIIDP